MSRIVLFDLDDTLYDYKLAHKTGLQKHRHLGHNMPDGLPDVEPQDQQRMESALELFRAFNLQAKFGG